MSGGTKHNPYLIAMVVTLAAFMEVVDTTIINVSLPYIAGDLGVSTDNAAWTLTTYLVANGVTLTISASLARRLGRKRYFLISIAGFTACSLACGLSTNFEELLLFRALQGLFGGGLQPMQQDIVLDTFPPEKRQAALSITAVATIIAPVVGPLIGGYLTFNYSWHWIFLINVPVGLLTIFGVVQLIEDPPEMKEQRRTVPRFDWIGTVLIVLALGCMELGADRGEDYDWLASGFIRVMFGLSIFGYLGGVVYLTTAKDPVVNLAVFKNRNFALSWWSMAMMGFALYASAIIMPLFAQNVLGYNSVLAGWVLAPGAFVLLVLIPIVSQVLNLVPVKWVIAAGGLALAASLYYSMGLVPDLDFFHVALYRAAQTAALALLFVPLSASAYSTIPPELKADAASLFTMARNVYGGVGISLTGNLGLRALDASYLTRWASHFYSAGPSLSLPIFQGGALTANLRLNRAQAAEAGLHYRATVLNALREVENGLVTFRADRVERDRLAAVVQSGRDTLYLASNRYAHGLSDYLQVLDAQRTVEDSRQQLVQEDMTLANDVGAYTARWAAAGRRRGRPARRRCRMAGCRLRRRRWTTLGLTKRDFKKGQGLCPEPR